jgi:hypothetical protein
MLAATRPANRKENKMAKKQALVKRLTPAVPVPAGGEARDVHMLIAQAIDRNVNVETMEKLLAMRQQLKSEWSREQYHAALSAFQAECPIIKKSKVVMNKDGKTERYRYAPIDSIISQLKSLIEKHGFNYRVDAGIDGRVVQATCIVTHKEGHSEQSSFGVPIDPEAYMNEAQKYASALTFAKRYAFCDAFGVLTGDEDSDAVSIAASSPTIGHRRTKAYEEETGKGDPKVQNDLADLNTFLASNKIPDGFLLHLLQEKKLIDGHTKSLEQLKPGVLRRCLDDKTKANLIKAWSAQQADEESGSQEAPTPTPPVKKDRHPFGGDEPDLKAPAAKPEKDKAAAREEVHTNEGDQRTQTRQPVVKDIAPNDVLEQEDIDNWRKVKLHFGKQAGTPLGKLQANSLRWWIDNYVPKPYKGTWQEKDLLLDAALCLASEELAGE